MAAFERCVARRGLAETTLTDIADEAGLPRSLIRYFMGNRDEMVDRLVERLVARATMALEALGATAPVTLDRLLDLFIDDIFADQLANAVMTELWEVSRSDPHVAARVRGVYEHAIGVIEAALEKDGVGETADNRRTTAFALLALILGQSSLNDFGLYPPDRSAVRRAVRNVVAASAPTPDPARNTAS